MITREVYKHDGVMPLFIKGNMHIDVPLLNLLRYFCMSAGYCRCVMFLYHDAQMHLPRCICLQFARTPVAPGCCCNHLEILGSTAGGWCVTGFDFISNLVFICSTAQCCTNADSTNQRKSLAESLKLLERYVLFSWSVPGWRCVCGGGVGGGGGGMSSDAVDLD